MFSRQCFNNSVTQERLLDVEEVDATATGNLYLDRARHWNGVNKSYYKVTGFTSTVNGY